MSLTVGKVVNALYSLVGGSAEAAEPPAAKEIVLEGEHIPNFPAGIDTCEPRAMQASHDSPEGRQFVASDVLLKYFLNPGAPYSSLLKNPDNKPLTEQQKQKLLKSPDLLKGLAEKIAAANGGHLYYDQFEPKGIAKEFNYGSYLYTCGENKAEKMHIDNPNAKTVGFFHAMVLLPVDWVDGVAGTRPTLRVPITQIANAVNEAIAKGEPGLAINPPVAAPPLLTMGGSFQITEPAQITAQHSQQIVLTGGSISGITGDPTKIIGLSLVNLDGKKPSITVTGAEKDNKGNITKITAQLDNPKKATGTFTLRLSVPPFPDSLTDFLIARVVRKAAIARPAAAAPARMPAAAAAAAPAPTRPAPAPAPRPAGGPADLPTCPPTPAAATLRKLGRCK